MIKRILNYIYLLRSKLPDLVFYSGFIFVSSQMGAVLNFITNLLIVPKYLNKGDLGLIAPITQYVALGTLPLGVITSLVVKYVTRYEANGEWGKLKCLVRDLFFFGGVSTLAIAVFFVLGYDAFALRMGISSKWIFFLMLLHLCVSSYLPLVTLLNRSMQHYFLMSAGNVLSPLALMFFAIFLLPVYGINGYLISLIVSVFIGLLISLHAIYRYFSPHKERLTPYFHDCKDVLKKYSVVLVFGSGSVWLWGFVPPFVVKHFLSDTDAAGYYLVQRLSQLPFYAFSTLMLVLFPLLSISYEKGNSTERTVKFTVLYTVISGIAVIVLLYFFAPVLFEFVPQWRGHSEYSKYVWFLSVNVVLAAINAILSTDFAAKWVFTPAFYKLPVSFFMVVLIYCLFGWGAFRNYIPDMIWDWVNNNFKPGLYSLFTLMMAYNVIILPVNYYWYRKTKKLIGG